MVYTDKVIFITGAANGIGQYLAKALYQRGATLVAADVQFDKLQAQVQENQWEANRAMIVPLDVSNLESWKTAFARTLEKFGKIDVMINVAGIILPGFIHQTAFENIDRHIDINLKGVIYGTKLAAEWMVSRRQGQIINIASLAGLTPGRGLNLYCASKFGVRGFSLSVAHELREHNVFVSVVCPDLVDTGMLTTQLDYHEAAITFSGNRALTVPEIGEVIIRQALEKKRLEVVYPAGRGFLAKLSGWFPSLGVSWISRILLQKGLQNQAKYKRS